jgi:hypothetical protein
VITPGYVFPGVERGFFQYHRDDIAGNGWGDHRRLEISNELICQTARNPYMAKYGKKAVSKVEKAMHERKMGTLRSGKSGKKVTSRKQAIAIGLSQARKAGAKVPRQKKK